MKKLTLPFVNEGKPFSVSDLGTWTVKKHKSALTELKKNTKNLSAEEQDEEFKFYVIHTELKLIDESVTLEAVKKLHVENVVVLFNVIYYAGKDDIFFHTSTTKGKNKSK